MGNESSSAKRRQQQQEDGGTTAKAGNGTRPLSANLEDNGTGKGGKSSSFRRRTKSDATASSKSPPANQQQAPPTQAPPPAREEEVNVSIKIYRSMNNLDDSAKKAPIESLHDKVPDYKIHRRSNVDVSEMQPGSSQSLPRSLSRRNRPRSTLSVSHDGTVVVETGTPADYPELRNSRNRSSAGSEPGTPKARQSTLPKKVTLLMSDFPSTSETRRKLKLFEVNFIQSLVARFERLDPVQRLSILLLAVRFDKAGNELLSLWHYSSRTDLEADIFASTTDTDRFYSLQPDAILAQAVQLKRLALDADDSSNGTDAGCNDLWLSLARDVAVSIATEAGTEVARVYEYQVALLGEDASNAIAAAHAAECALNYVLDKGFPLDRNSAVQGVVYGRAEYHAATPTMFSVVMGNSELKWELHDLFQKPGLRKDVALVSASQSEPGSSAGGFRYFASKQSDGQLYGYRGQIVDWDMGRGTYKLNPADEEQFTVDETGDSEDSGGVDVIGDNVHRFYRPFRRLVGYELMAQYCSDALLNQREGIVSLRRYLLGPHDEAAERDDVQPVYRPLSKDKKKPLTFHKTRLDSADLSRTRFPKTEWQQVTSARGTSLLHCDLGPSLLNTSDWERLEAADLSYSKVCVSEAPTLKKLRAVYTLFDVITDPGTTGTSLLITNDRGILKTAAEAIEDKKMQVAEQAAAANESVIRASVVTGASAAPGKAQKRATVTGDELLRSSSAASSNGGTTERGKKRNTMPPTAIDKSATNGETPVRKTNKSKSPAGQSQTLPRPSSSSTPQDTRLGSASSATSRESAASGGGLQAAGQKTSSKQASPSIASRTPTKPDSPMTPRSPDERGSANRSSFGQVVTTFMSTPLDEAKYGSLRSSWQQSPEEASPIPSSGLTRTSHHDTNIDDGDAPLRRESAVNGNGGHVAVAGSSKVETVV